MSLYASSQVFASRAGAQALAAVDQLVVVDRRDEVLEEAAPLPYTTADLLEDATSRWGWSGQQVMELAQELFEMGWITYPRTDSTRIAPEAQAALRDTVAAIYGPDVLGPVNGDSGRKISPKPEFKTVLPGFRGVGERFLPRFAGKAAQNTKLAAQKPQVKTSPQLSTGFATKTGLERAQDAHEAIRPVNPGRGSETLDGNREQVQLYELIWRRSLASQMKAARYRRITVTLEEAD